MPLSPSVHSHPPARERPAGRGLAGVLCAVALVGAAPATVGATQPPAPPVTMAEQLGLGLDGLGGITFGGDAETVIADVAALLGSPTDDSGWVHPSLVSACPGGEARSVAWGQLTLYFGDAPVLLPVDRTADAATSVPVAEAGATGAVTVAVSDPEAAAAEGSVATTPHELDIGSAPTAVEGARRFFAYTYGQPGSIEVSPADLATNDGIGVGTPVALLVAVYPDVYLEQGEEGFMESRFYVDEHLQGILTDAGPEGLITVIVGGNACMMTL